MAEKDNIRILLDRLGHSTLSENPLLIATGARLAGGIAARAGAGAVGQTVAKVAGATGTKKVIDKFSGEEELEEGGMKRMIDTIEDWINQNYDRYNGDRDRMLMVFRKKFKSITGAEDHFHQYINTNLDINESNYPDDFSGVPGDDYDDVGVLTAIEDAEDEVHDWLSTEPEGQAFIAQLSDDTLAPDEKEEIIDDKMIVAVKKMVDYRINHIMGYNNDDYITTEEAKDMLLSWLESKSINIHGVDEAYNSLDKLFTELYADKDDDLPAHDDPVDDWDGRLPKNSNEIDEGKLKGK